MKKKQKRRIHKVPFCPFCSQKMTAQNIATRGRSPNLIICCIECNRSSKAERSAERNAERRWRKIEKQKKCPYCLIELTKDNATKDHMIPKSRGGKGLSDNIVICCKDCNSKKANLTPLEFFFGCKREIVEVQ